MSVLDKTPNNALSSFDDESLLNISDFLENSLVSVFLSNSETQWTAKYDAFFVEKNIITESGLSEDDKAGQIENLIQQHYQENEWAAARAYDLMVPTNR